MAPGSRTVADMLAALVEYRESEFARVSRLLHDEVGQVLSAVGLQLEALRMDFQDRVPELTERTAEIQNILEQAVKLVRNLSYELNPAIVDRAGLPFSLDRLVGRFRDNFPGTIRLLHDPGAHVPGKIGSAFYKIAEQAIGNAVAHAQCSLIEIWVRPTKAGIALEIRDNGRGFDVTASRAQTAGLGLTLMEHYAAEAGLAFSVVSEPGRGTTVRAVYRAAPKTAPAELGEPAH